MYLKTDQNFYCSYWFDSPEEGTVFLYMTTTAFDNYHQSEDINIIEVLDFRKDDSMVESGDADKNAQAKAVYYVSEEYAKQLKKQGYWSSGEEGSSVEESEANYLKINQEKLEELKKESVLIWKAE